MEGDPHPSTLGLRPGCWISRVTLVIISEQFVSALLQHLADCPVHLLRSSANFQPLYKGLFIHFKYSFLPFLDNWANVYDLEKWRTHQSIFYLINMKKISQNVLILKSGCCTKRVKRTQFKVETKKIYKDINTFILVKTKYFWLNGDIYC